MKTGAIPILATLTVVLVFGSATAQGPPSDDALLKYANDLESLTRVTAKPVVMSPKAAAMCASITQVRGGHENLASKTGAVIHVYVTPSGAAAMKKSTKTFPIGTVILKQKFPTSTSTTPELFTGMLKREKGFNPECGDWEFFTLSGNAKAVTTRGRIDSCMSCHKGYGHSDFVTKRYR